MVVPAARARLPRRGAPHAALVARQLRLAETDGPAIDPLADIANRDQLERAFRTLSVDHRAVVVLHHLDVTQTEVAAALGIPVGTAGSRLHYAMKALHAALDAAARPALQQASR